jgi:ketosteroid isomerase-like protein
MRHQHQTSPGEVNGITTLRRGLMKRLIATAVLMLVLSLNSLPKDTRLTPAQAELVAAERAFAKLSVDRGIRESFITYFAADGIGFGPHPYKVKEVLSNGPVPATRSPIVLNWAPIYGDIAGSGDLGYNTGPTVFEDRGPNKTPTAHGIFFSVWKRQSDGSWRVALDLGGPTPSPIAPLDAPFLTAHRNTNGQPAAAASLGEGGAGLLGVEREFLAEAKSRSVGKAYADHLSGDARLHRPDMMPVIGKIALRSWLGRQTMTLSGEPIKAEVASSGELGYAYGSYELGGAQLEKGYYARVWKRDQNGKWRIVMDVLNPIPPGQ